MMVKPLVLGLMATFVASADPTDSAFTEAKWWPQVMPVPPWTSKIVDVSDSL
jgi:hypothetical protein